MGKTKAPAPRLELKTKASLEFRVNSQTIIAESDILPCRQYTFPLGWSGSTKPPQVAEGNAKNESTAAHVQTGHEEYERAGLKPRPKRFQNLRALVQRNFARSFPRTLSVRELGIPSPWQNATLFRPPKTTFKKCPECCQWSRSGGNTSGNKSTGPPANQAILAAVTKRKQLRNSRLFS